MHENVAAQPADDQPTADTGAGFTNLQQLKVEPGKQVFLHVHGSDDLLAMHKELAIICVMEHSYTPDRLCANYTVLQGVYPTG